MRTDLAHGKVKKTSINKLFWSVILVAYFTNFMDYGIYLPILFLPYIFYYFSYNCISRRFLLSFSVLLLFSIAYGVTRYIQGLVDYPSQPIMYLFYPIILFSLGYILAASDVTYRKTYYYIYLIIGSLSAFGVLSIIKTILQNGDMHNALYGRVVTNLWNDNLITATGLNTYLSVGLILLPIIFISDKNNKKWLSLIYFLGTTTSVIVLGNRTGFLITIASFFTITLYSKKLSFSKLIRIILLILFIYFLLNLFELNLFGLKDLWSETYLGSRLSVQNFSEDPRINAWEIAFKGMFDYPFGGRKTLLPLYFAHNMWLDAGYDAGVIPFTLLVMFSIRSIKALLVFIKKTNPTLLKSLFIGLFTSSFITFMLEPIMQGWFTFFTIFCFIVGMVERLIIDNKQIENHLKNFDNQDITAITTS